jgi:hypothetical protein
VSKNSRERVALRKAAVAFGRGVSEPVKDSHDRAGRARDERLLRAALRVQEPGVRTNVPIVLTLTVKYDIRLAGLADITEHARELDEKAREIASVESTFTIGGIKAKL